MLELCKGEQERMGNQRRSASFGYGVKISKASVFGIIRRFDS